jgi:hypothetical protein
LPRLKPRSSEAHKNISDWEKRFHGKNAKKFTCMISTCEEGPAPGDWLSKRYKFVASGRPVAVERVLTFTNL